MPSWKFWKCCYPCRRFKNEEIIKTLDHSNFALTDVPPDISQHERTLEELYLSSNRISALPPQLFYCQEMRTLFANDNELEALPSAIGSLRHLHSLNLARNSLSTIPENITSCKNLTRIDLSLNNLQRLPDAITGVISLQELLLNETNLDFLPANFGRLINLKILELRSNNLITLPKSMSRLTCLNRLDIGANEFTELPEVICQLTLLHELWIDANRIRRISPNVSNLRELKHFQADKNLLTTLPNEISHWRNLEVLSISMNDIESLPFSIGMLKSLVTLQIEANDLRELPDSIGHLESLEELVINHNFILRLPRTIGMLRKLRFCCADNNILRNLPTEICSCNSLVVLSVRKNKISELPHNIGHVENLQVLNLVDNYITHLPVSVLSLTKLTALWISDNQSQPLVPLQYLNDNTKSHLTCFMLPQQAAVAQQNVAHIIDRTDNNSTNSLSHQQEHGQVIFNAGRATNPSQRLYFADQQGADTTFTIPDSTLATQSSRICFAKEERVRDASLMSECNPGASPMRRICFADEVEVKGSENFATRLMRSPTPYPKELRVMAKLVRNSHQQHQQKRQAQYFDNTLDQTPLPVSEALNSEKPVEENKHLSESLSATASAGGVKEARILSNPSGISVMLQQMQNSMSYHLIDQNRTHESEVDDLPKVQYFKQANIYASSAKSIQANHYTKQPQQPSGIDVSRGGRLTPTAFINQVPNILIPQQQYYQHYLGSMEQQNNCQEQKIYLDQGYSHSLYEQQMRETLKNDISTSVPQVSASPSKMSLYSQQKLQQPQYSLYNVQAIKPPPYHIARAYTKKSREDLLNYDTFHSKIQYTNGTGSEKNLIGGVEVHEDAVGNDQTLSKSDDINYSALNDNQTNYSTNHHRYLNDNDFDAVDYQNNNSLSRTFSLDSLQVGENGCYDEGETRRPHSKLSQHQNWTNGCVVDETYNDKAPGSEQLINSGPELRPSRSASTTAWLFGPHKNPTVKQVAIKRDHEIGFDVMEKSNQGIFVRGTHPNTSAALLLHANDKLLEVNGYDFTKICLLDAQKILENCGPLINVMISRT